MSTLFSRHRISRILYLDTESKQVFYLVITKRVCSFVRLFVLYFLVCAFCVFARVCVRVCAVLTFFGGFVITFVRTLTLAFVRALLITFNRTLVRAFVRAFVITFVRTLK